MVEIGQISLITSFIVVLYTSIVGFAGGVLNGRDLAQSARWGFYSLPILLIVTTITLIYSFVINDFSVKYVAENSNLAMPSAYAWVAFYSGNEGSLLYIAAAFSIMSSVSVLILNKKLPYTAPYALGVMSLVLLFFIAVLLFMANPLEKLPIVPADGKGINPLLIHFGMFIHPPFQMLGLISVAIPFSVCIATLISGRGSRDEWVDQGRLWGMISWLLLTIGLILGGWWAYTILGWGGYWAWDPVENSALMPWLAMTAFVHSIMVQKRRGLFRMWNMILIITAFTMAQLGMFINRGGPVPSVHSFAESTMGWVFLGVMAVTLFLSIVIFVFRFDTLKSRGVLESPISREAVFLSQNALFLLIAFVTLWGTIFPIFSETFDETTMTIGQPFFNKVNGPLMLLLIFLMGIGPLLPWRKASLNSLFKMLTFPLILSILIVSVCLLLGLTKIWAIFGFATCAIALGGIIQEWFRGTKSRVKRGDKIHLSFIRLINSNRPRYGGYIVHISIIMLAMGITASSFYDVQKDVVMAVGESESIGDYTFKYLGVSQEVFPDRIEETAKFELWTNGKFVDYLYPYRAFYPEFRLSATRGAIHSNLIRDFYLVPSDFKEDGQALFRVLINPMVSWMWISGPILIFGTIFSLTVSSSRRRKKIKLPIANSIFESRSL